MHLDLIYPNKKGRIFSLNGMILNAIFRFKYADYNKGNFEETKANYSRHWERDILGNPTVKTAGFQFGFASCF